MLTFTNFINYYVKHACFFEKVKTKDTKNYFLLLLRNSKYLMYNYIINNYSLNLSF